MKDHNTKFFHAWTIFKKKRNEILQLNIDGRSIQGVSSLKREVRNYFSQRFTQDRVPAFDFTLDNHQKITAAQADFLETIPSRDEVK